MSRSTKQVRSARTLRSAQGIRLIFISDQVSPTNKVLGAIVRFRDRKTAELIFANQYFQNPAKTHEPVFLAVQPQCWCSILAWGTPPYWCKSDIVFRLSIGVYRILAIEVTTRSIFRQMNIYLGNCLSLYATISCSDPAKRAEVVPQR